MTDKRHCPKCGAELSADAAHGLCPRCLLDAGLDRAAVMDALRLEGIATAEVGGTP